MALVEREESDPPPPEVQELRFGGDKGVKAVRTGVAPTLSPISLANWQELGPINMFDVGRTSAYEPSQGRMNCVAADPKNTQHLYACGATGGVWVTSDGGTTWAPRAQNLPMISTTSIVVDPNNGNLVYVATGDADGRVTPTIGIYKSSDGGATWTATSFPSLSGAYITKLAIDPANGAIVYASVTNGVVYYTRDGGANWTPITPDAQQTFAAYRDIKVKPGSPGTLYTVSDAGRVYRSVDSGATWAAAAGGPDATVIRRAVLAVTAADPNIVYLLAATSTDLQIFKSTDSGGSFAEVASPSLKEFASAQATFFDLVLAASPTNANELMGGAFSVFRSTDGGATWIRVAGGIDGRANPIVHVDQHCAEYVGNSFYDCSDGGLHRTDDGANSWTNLSPSLGVAQIYQLSGSKQNPNLIFVGEQDNGFNRFDGTKWEHANVGDFGRVAVDPTNDGVVYASCNYAFFKYTNGAGAQLNITTEGKRFEGAAVAINSATPQVVYAGYQNVFRSNDAGGTWQNISNFPADGLNVDVISIAPSDTRTMYVGRSASFSSSGKLFRTTDDGATFTDITGTLPRAVTGIAVDPKNASRLWVTVQGGRTLAVYFSQDGGASWTNYSGTTLPNSSTRSIVYENNTQDALYIGTVAGVYYRNATMNDWQPYNNGLPNVIVNSLEIDYNSRKLRAGTYGRGAWQSDLATATTGTAQLLNISTRLKVLANDNVAIAGFIVTGNAGATKKVMIRGLGPSLAAKGVPSPLSDPFLDLRVPNAQPITNDNWQDAPNKGEIPQGFQPTDPKESVIITSIPIGASGTTPCTCILRGANGETGGGLIEVYDLETANGQLANISTRGFIDTGDNAMIGGFISGPNTTGSSRIVVRGIGPSLNDSMGQPLAGRLFDPILTLNDANGAAIATNDNWKIDDASGQSQEATITATKLQPTNDAEAALYKTLAPGAYTAIVRGKNNGSGIGLVEVYNLQ